LLGSIKEYQTHFQAGGALAANRPMEYREPEALRRQVGGVSHRPFEGWWDSAPRRILDSAQWHTSIFKDDCESLA